MGDYYRRCASGPYLAAIRVPTLVVHADDDPWIPAPSIRTAAAGRSPAVTLRMAVGGGHVGFHARGEATPWSDGLIVSHFAAVEAPEDARGEAIARR